MSTKSITELDAEIADLAAACMRDPLRWARIAFPWGQPGLLSRLDGPCPCQTKVLTILGDEVRKRAFNGRDAVAPIRIAVSSGHGTGKGVLSGIIVNWIESTRPHCQGTITATTFNQLETKTWATIQAMFKLSITSHWFEIGASRIYKKEAKETWFSSPQTSSEENSEAFAGQHAASSTSFYVNDESSGIPDIIFEIQEGGMTDGEPMQFIFGNPTKATGKLQRVMWGNEKHRYIRITIDSRDCPLTNKELIQELVDFYGEDSDFVKVRVRGLPPSIADSQFIGQDLVNEAMSKKRAASYTNTDALIAGCDLSWGGEDKCCVRFRRGCDARTIPPIYVAGERTRDPNTMVRILSEVLTRTYNGQKVDMLFLDSAGICGPVARKLRELGHKNIIEVNFGAQSTDPKYKLMRSYMWGMVKEALPQLALDNCPELAEDLMAPEYSLTRSTEILLEPKEMLRKPERLGRSTDDADALALTYAMPVVSQAANQERYHRNNERPEVLTEWS